MKRWKIWFMRESNNMNSKDHLYISLAKSSIRILGCIGTYFSGDVMILVGSFGFAELLGVIEELADKR